MKKRKIKNLSLRKKTVSNLDIQKIKGGTLGAICIILSVVYNCDTGGGGQGSAI